MRNQFNPYRKKPRNKHKSIKTVVDGITFDSRTEARYYQYLQLLKQQGVVKSFTMQQKFLLKESFVVDGEKRRAITYTPDFIVQYTDGTEKIIDVKGSLHSISKDFPLRKKMFEERYGKTVHVHIYSARDGGWVDSEMLKKKEKARAAAKKQALQAYRESKRHLL